MASRPARARRLTGGAEYLTPAVTNPPYIPPNQAPLETVRQAISNDELALLVGPYDGSVAHTTYGSAAGDQLGARWEWDSTSTSSGPTFLGSAPQGRWSKIIDPSGGGGGSSNFTGPSVSFTANGTINTSGIVDAAYFAVVPTGAYIARGLTPPAGSANINVRHAFNNSNFTLTVPHEDTGASAAARFATDDTLGKAWPGKTWMTFAYDTTSSRYRARQEADPRSLLYTDLATTAPRAVGEVRQIHGRLTLNDGGEGYFRAVSSSGLTIDGGIVSASATSGYYWQRIYRPSYVSVKWFGGGMGGAGDAAAFQAAHAAASAGGAGGTVHMPRGIYTWDNLSNTSIGNKVSIVGDGRDTIFRRPDNANGSFGEFEIFGTTGVRLRSFKIEIEVWINFIRMIDAYGADGTLGVADCVIDGIRFEITDACYNARLAAVGGDESLILGNSTLHAVLADNAVDLSVTNCSFRRCQAKLATFGSATRVRFENNYSDDPLDFAMSVVSSNATPGTRDFIGLKVNNNFVNNPRSSGGIFLGADAETGQTRKMEDVQCHGNTIRQDIVLAGVQILIHLGNASLNVSVCNNTLVNKSATFNGSSLIRIRCTEAVKRIENLLVAGNICDGADHGGIWLDVNGKNVVVANNIVSRCRGIYVYAANGTLDTVLVQGNVCSAVNNTGYYFLADTGSMTNLMVDSCVANDIVSFSTASAGAWFEASSGKTITGVVRNFRGKKKDSNNPGLQMFWQLGAGTIRLEYVDCDATEWRDFADIDCGIALGHHNKGYGAPDYETVTLRTPDVATASDDDILSRCWGKVKYAKFRLAAAITGANVVMTYKCETGVGAGTYNTLTGTITAIQAGSDEGNTYWQALTGTNDIVPRAKIRASCDGGATNGIGVIGDTTFWIDRAA